MRRAVMIVAVLLLCNKTDFVMAQVISESLFTDELKFLNVRVPVEDVIVQDRLNRALETIRSRPKIVEAMRRKSTHWFPMIESHLVDYDLHDDFKYLFVQESGLDPHARSRVGATGIAQFMRETAREWGLMVNGQRDDRLNPNLAIPGSIRYLNFLIGRFDSTCLAMTAYNGGIGRLERVLENEELSCFHLTSLPMETIEYPYRILAWKIILEDMPLNP